MTRREPVVGWHLIAELRCCDPSALDDEAALRAAMVSSCRRANATVLATQSHHFEPHGVTAVVLMAESHMSIHTWPESGYAALDIFTCGDRMRPEQAVELMCQHVAAGAVQVRRVRRGSDDAQ